VLPFLNQREANSLRHALLRLNDVSAPRCGQWNQRPELSI
jgi:hypothetical protein